MWNDSVITNAGAALLAQIAGGGTLIIDGAKAGTATVPAVNLAAQTALSGTEHDLLIARSVDVEAGRKITVQIRPESAAYTIKQIGLFAHVEDGEETLLAIYQDSTGINIPDSASMPDYISNFFAIVTISNTLSVSVTIDTSAAVSAGDLEAGLATKQDKIDSAHKLLWNLIEKPDGGIPKTDLSSAVQASLALADSAYQVRGTAISSSTDLASLQPGIYEVPGVRNSTFPTDDIYFGALVVCPGSYKGQILVAGISNASGLYARRYYTGSSSWGPWKSIDDGATTATYTATIPSTSWTGSAAPYYKDVTVNGILSTDTPIIDIVQTGTKETDDTMRENWGKITRITTSANKIRVYADEVPSAQIPIQIKCVR